MNTRQDQQQMEPVLSGTTDHRVRLYFWGCPGGEEKYSTSQSDRQGRQVPMEVVKPGSNWMAATT